VNADIVRPASGNERLDRLDCVALAYLGLPNIIFLAAWIVTPLGPIAALLVGLGILFLMRGARPMAAPLPRLAWLVALAAATLWLIFSGVGHVVYANTDWEVRDVVLHDLSTLPWPVQYSVSHLPAPVLLRAPLGYFLPTALISRLAGFGVSQVFLFLWTLAGVVICFLMLARRTRSTRAFAVLIAVFVFFSGLDMAGMLSLGRIPALGDHLEWWAALFQYSSDTTQLFWVPNHALPAWIVTLWLLDASRARMPLAPAIVLLALVPLWSPLAAIGLAPLVAAVALRDGWHALSDSAATFWRWLRQLANPAMIVVAGLTLVLVDPFLLMASGSVPAGWVSDRQGTLALVERTALFIMIEFGLYWMLMLRRYGWDLLLTTSGVILLLLPWYRFGPGSDLTMRASIPALVVFAVRLGDWFVERLVPEGPLAGDAFASFAMLAFIVGMVTPFQEMVRPFLIDASPMDVSSTVYGLMHEEGTHYLTERKGAWADHFLAEPAAPSSARRGMQ
jgi:hypothetical protein